MLKKLITLLLYASLTLTIASCGDDDDDEETTTTPSVTSTWSSINTYMLGDGGCMSGCHASGGTAAGIFQLVSGNATTNYSAVTASSTRVNTGTPTSSTLLSIPSGTSHSGGQKFTSGSTTYNAILEWIQGGAQNN